MNLKLKNGYHRYRDIWEAEVRENIQCERKIGNIHDLYTEYFPGRSLPFERQTVGILIRN